MDAGDIKMIAGLGNPGKEYVGTRHNAGFAVIDLLVATLEIDVRKRKFGARWGSGEFAGKKLILLKPQRFMNLSGHVVATAMGFYKLDITDLLVVSDDMALETGRIRIRAAGSSGGHHGLDDIIEKMGTDSFSRLRIGIGQSRDSEAVDYVLDKPTKAERPLIDDAIGRAEKAVLWWVEHGVESAMNKFNN